MSESFKNGINLNTYDLLFSDSYNHIKDSESKDRLNKLLEIDRFTLYEKRNLLIRLKDDLLKLKGINIDEIKYDSANREYYLIYNGTYIYFRKLSDYVNNQFVKSDLLKESRYNDSHNGSLNLSRKIKDSYVVTGEMKFLDNKILHSVVEFNSNEETKIADYTRNLVMDKSDFYRLSDFHEITRFKGDNIIDELYDLPDQNLDIKAYLCFRDEIQNDLNKNKSLIKKD